MRCFRFLLFMLALLASVGVWGQYNPSNPAEPGVSYTLSLLATPSGGGSFNLSQSTACSEGTSVSLRAYANTSFRFVAWEEDGRVLSSSPSFVYTMPARNASLVARFSYDPSSPGEPSEPQLPVYSTLSLSVSPSGSGGFNVSDGNRYEAGSTVYLSAYANSNFVFKNWTENGSVVSTSRSFAYTVKAGNPKLVANFVYSPSSPGEPSAPQPFHKVYVDSNPSGGGYFNVSSGNAYQEGSSLYLCAYSNQWYRFQNWTLNGEVVSTSSAFYFTVPSSDARLVANYSYNYNPSNPSEPSIPSGQNASIYGMTENGVRGQTITYPVYLANDMPANGMNVDLQFPDGFVVNTSDVRLSGRASGHAVSVVSLGGNAYRFLLSGDAAFDGSNGKVFDVLVTIPSDAQMGSSYPVTLSHGVVLAADGKQSAVSVRGGNIYVEKVSEDGLYARFSFDKLHGRVKFTNLSSDKAVSCLWDFGDGTTSTERSPMHVYGKSGTYIVRLTAHGSVDSDVAEATVVVNDERTWRIDGTFFLSGEESGVRYFTSADSLFSFLGGTQVSGDIKVAVEAGRTFACHSVSASSRLLDGLFKSLSAAGRTLTLVKSGSGRNPVIAFGESGAVVDKGFVSVLMSGADILTCTGVELRLWNIGFDPTAIRRLDGQKVKSGDRTQEVDFSSVSADLAFVWQLQSVPSGLSGCLASGERTIPSMTVVNDGDGVANLVYRVVGKAGDVEFCTFDYCISVSPALVGLFTSLTPADGAVLESPSVTLTWNSIRNAVYDVYLWNAADRRPSRPVASGLTDLRYTSRDFCQNGNAYKWQVVARNDLQTLASDTLTFAVRTLPNLHVYSVDCSEAVAGRKLTVRWTVRNDGAGSTGDTRWNDYVWLVADVYGGTAPSGASANSAQLLSTMPNVKALDSGESYDNSVDITLDERVYGNYYVIVTADMYSVSDIQWAAVGGTVPDPYRPSQDGSTSYRHLYATTSAAYNKVYEQGETPTLSDNFFYRKISIAVPQLADLQIPSVTSYVLPNVDPFSSRAVGVAPIDDDKDDQLITWRECWTPSPITAAGLRHSTNFYSGKKVAVSVKVANRGGKDTEKAFKTALYMSAAADPTAAPLILVESKACPGNIAVGCDTTLTYAFYLPYYWHGPTYFHAYADVDDAVYELANTANNWGHSEKIDVLLCPGADLVPTEVVVPKSIAPSAAFDVSYKVANRGTGIPLPNGPSFVVRNWTDRVYISKKNTGLDDTAVLVATVSRQGSMTRSTGGGISVLNAARAGAAYSPPKPEEYHYEGDNYSTTVAARLSAKDMTAGTYYVYVKVDADDDMYEYDGESNNVICSAPVTFVQPDLSPELLSVSSDTLATGMEVAFVWKLKNVGSGDIQDAKIVDRFYAANGPDAVGGEIIGSVENTVWIAAGSEKTLRANIKIPEGTGLDGLRYIYVATNVENTLTESSAANNRSATVKSWRKYQPATTKPAVSGYNLSVGQLAVPASAKPGQELTLTYTVSNTGDADLPDVDVSHEVFVSSSPTDIGANAVPCTVTSVKGTARALKAGKSVVVSLTFVVPATVEGGNRCLCVVADRLNVLADRITRDNIVGTHFFIDGNRPDLTVTSCVLPDTIKTSESVALKFAIANRGDWDAPTSDVVVSLSPSRDAVGTRLVSLPVGPVAKGGQVECTATFTVADSDYGKWYVIVRADGTNRVAESDETNNVIALPVTVVQSPLPDLAVTALSVDGSIVAGRTVTVRTVVANTGASATRTDKWADAYYLSPGTVLNAASAIKLGSKAHVGVLAPGTTYMSEVSLNIPADAEGNFMLFAVTDASDALVESSENNNARSVPVCVGGMAATPSDLVVSAVSAPSVIKAGSSVTISYKVGNIGAFAANGTLNDVIYLSKDKTWDKNDTMVGVVSGVVSIDPGQQLTRTVTGRITNMPEGTYYVIVKTNSTKAVAESDYDNNASAAGSPSKLSFVAVGLGGRVAVATSGYCKLEVPSGYDGKTVGLYLDHPEGASAGLYAAYESVPSTAAYGWVSTSVGDTRRELLLPNVKAGTYYILAQDNAAVANVSGNVFAEVGGDMPATDMTLSAQEVSFGATALGIAEGGSGGWVSTDVRGALFDSIMDFRLKLAETVIPAESVVFSGMTSSRVTFNLNGASVGAYDVVSELPDGTQATLQHGFRVVSGASVGLNAKIDAPHVVRTNSYAPFSVTYANGGNTDCEVYRLMLVIDNGYLGTSIKDLDRHESVLYLDLGGEGGSRGYTSIPPGEQKTVNLFMYQLAATSHITIYVVK